VTAGTSASTGRPERGRREARDGWLMDGRCSALRRDGSRCSAPAQPGKATCWGHDPELIAKRQEGRRKGGYGKSNAARARKQLIDGALSPAELEGLLGVTLKAVLAGSKEPGVGNAVANLARAAIAVRESAALEDRVADLQRQVDDLLRAG
jgi:hypothetical protein